MSIWIFAAVVVVVIVVSHILSVQSVKKARAKANELGVQVLEVKRAVPVSKNRGVTYELKEIKVLEYLLPSAYALPQWKLLQRFDRDDGRIDNSWLVETDVELLQTLKEAIDYVKKNWECDFLEFESGERGVAAYWEEWGGEKTAQEVCDYLYKFKEACEKDG